MVEVAQATPQVEPLDEESVFIADFQRQWDLEAESKDNLLRQLLRPRFELAEQMKDSAQRVRLEVKEVQEDVADLFARGDTAAVA